VRTGKGKKRKIEKEFLSCKKIEEAVSKISGLIILLYSAADVNYFSTRKLTNRHRLGGKKLLFDLLHLFGILVWR